MPFMTTQELLSQRRFTQENIRNLQEVLPELQAANRDRAVSTITNLIGQLDRIAAELAMATAS
ncbi:hypothetical protein [Pseudomonas sp.]|uniref:hypothetical protein n=1 Tax=Pseudomonas sp. TaxID=306 RepID=UPI00272F916D|nr:hypothetical protein [Pseudomonas sp.]MDP2244053.1 hypothetical protein [Pseudomonas sp.]